MIHIHFVQELLQAQGKNEEPVFCTNGATRFDIAQGALGKKDTSVKC